MLLTGCSWFVHSQGFRYDNVDRGARPKDHPIPIVADPTRIDRPYVVIGMVQSDSGDMGGIAERELKEGLRKEARKMGGDALINLQRKADLRGRPETRADLDRSSDRETIKYSWVAEARKKADELKKKWEAMRDQATEVKKQADQLSK